MRVGLRLVIVALIAGLLVLLFNPSARSAEASASQGAEARASRGSASSGAEALLLEPATPFTPQERVERAEGVLRAEKRRRIGSLATQVLDLAVRGAMQASPGRLFGGLRDIGRDLLRLRERSSAESQALALLEADRRAGTLADSGSELYAELLRRERSERGERLLEEAEDALEGGRLWRARRSLRRALELDPDADRGERLLERVESRTRARETRPEIALSEGVADWEAPLAAALLAGNYDRVASFDADRPDARLARAAARYLSGERVDALDSLLTLGELEHPVGLAARAWLADPGINPEVAFDQELARYKRRRALGWVGGAALADNGLALSSSGYEAWKDSLSPLNLAVSAPSRALRGWKPDTGGLRGAADHYLQVLPQGARSGEARDWLETLPVDARSARRASLWDDGLLVLPPPQTDYAQRRPRPILMSTGTLGRDRFESLGLRLDGAAAVLLTPLSGGPNDVLEIPTAEALALIADLAAGIEERTLEPASDQSRAPVLETLRLLDIGIRAGTPIGVEAWVYLEQSTATVGLLQALEAGEVEEPQRLSDRLDGLALERRRKDLQISHAFAAREGCPEEVYCIDRARRVDGDVYARIGVDGAIRLGARTSFASASFALELNSGGAEASFSLPIARWLGLGRWIPMQASFGIGLDGVSIGARATEEEPVPASVY